MKNKNIISDLKAGLVVFLVALPLCLGIAMACNLPLFSGIISGVVGGLIVTLFSGSKFSVSGPAAGLTAIIIAAISQLGSFEALLAAVILAGVLQIILGLLKAGTIGNYIPNAVIKGMLAGIGIILITKQLPHLFGFNFNSDEIHLDASFFVSIANQISEKLSIGVLIIGFVSLFAILLAEKSFYKSNKFLSVIPGPLLAVLVGIVLNLAFTKLPQFHVDTKFLVNLPVISSFSELNNLIIFPDFSLIASSNFWIIVFTLAIVASLETLLGIEAVDKLDPDKNESNTNKELFAQGIGNIVSGFIGGLPLTSVIVRSSANIHAGAKSKISVIVHALLLIISVFLFPNILALIPNASLAAILIMTGFKLTKLGLYKKKWNKGIAYFLPFITTIVVMLMHDLLFGVFAGIIVAVFFIIRDIIKFSFDTSIEVVEDKKRYILKFPQQVTFFNKGFLVKYFKSIPEGQIVLIDGTINKTMNKDVKEVLEDFLVNSKKRDIEVAFKNYNFYETN